MFASLQLGAAVLAVAAAQPLLALDPMEAGALGPDHAVASTGTVDAAEAAAQAGPVSLSSAGSLAHVVAFSTAHLDAARTALQSMSEHTIQQYPPATALQQLPIVVSLRRRAGLRWNTTDSSRPSDFALCYRVSRVLGLQVIPGDLTPGKLPTPRMLSVKNQGSGMGVLVGMTFRLGRWNR